MFINLGAWPGKTLEALKLSPLTKLEALYK